MPSNEAEAAEMQDRWEAALTRKLGEFQLAHQQLKNAPVTRFGGGKAGRPAAFEDRGLSRNKFDSVLDKPDYQHLIDNAWYFISGEWFWADAKKDKQGTR